MTKEYTITKEEGIRRMCEAIREAHAISDAIDDEHLATNSTFSSVKIDSLLSNIDTRVDKLENSSIGGGSGSGGSITIDDALSNTSKNPVQNKVITAEIDKKANKDIYDDTTINRGRNPDTTVGDHSIAFGVDVEASGIGSHAEGSNTKAIGNYAFAGGIDAKANSNVSFAYGYGLETNKRCTAAFGEYNFSDLNTLFSIGDGYDSYDDNNAYIINRHNAFEITTDGGKLHGKDIVTDLIQRGTVSGTTISVTFEKSFKETPTVVCTACNSSPSAYYISNKSTTGFTITSNASQTYDWIAIGEAVAE